MFNFLKTTAVAAFAASALATGAQAVTLTFDTPTLSPGDTLSISSNTIGVDWVGGANITVDFTSTVAFQISLTSFAPDNANGDVSGFQVYDQATNTAQYTGFFACSYGPCVLVTGHSGTNATALQPGESAGVLAAGDYTFFFSEGSQPTDGSAEFLFSDIDGNPIDAAPIPLPAGAPLLVAGLGAFALLRKKRKS